MTKEKGSQRGYKVRVLAQPVPTTTTPTVSTVSTQMPAVRYATASILVMVYTLPTGQFAEVPHPTGRLQDKRNSSVYSNPPPLEVILNAPVRQGTPWPYSESAPEKLFEVRKEWPIPHTPVPTPAPTIKTEAPPQIAVILIMIVRPKQAVEG